jgi:hypothetical protein
MSVQESQVTDWSPRHASSYSEAGNLLRHYSSSRTAVLTIAIPICIIILGWTLASAARPRLALFLLTGEFLVFVYALILSLFFSAKYEQTRLVLIRIETGENAAVYSNIAGTRLRGRWHPDAIDKSLIAIGILFHITYYIYYFKR